VLEHVRQRFLHHPEYDKVEFRRQLRSLALFHDVDLDACRAPP